VRDAQNGNLIPILGDQHRAIIQALRCRAGRRELSRNRGAEGLPLPELGGFDEALPQRMQAAAAA